MSEAAKKKRNPPVLFAEHDGKLYVKVKAVMHWLIPFHDGLSVYTFKGCKHNYLDVDDAIDWCEREKLSRPWPDSRRPNVTYEKMIEGMKIAKAQMESDLAFQPPGASA